MRRSEMRLLLFLIMKSSDQLDPEYTGLYYHLAAIYAEEGNTEKALECYDEGIAMSSHQGDHMQSLNS